MVKQKKVSVFLSFLLRHKPEKMKRHAVHLQAKEEKAWQSAERWHLEPVVLKIDAGQMHQGGFTFGKSDNDVWCVEEVPVKFISERIYK